MNEPRISLGPASVGFRVSCDAGNTGKFQAEADSVWARIAQRIRRRGTEEMWDSVAIESTAEPDGTLVLRIIVFNPDWDEPLQIASIRSRPQDLDSLTPLDYNLDHVVLQISSLGCPISKAFSQEPQFSTRIFLQGYSHEIGRHSTGERYRVSLCRKDSC